MPEWLSLALHRAAARGRLSEKDALWGLLVANADLMRAYLEAEANGTKESIQKLEKQIRDLVRDIQYVKAPEKRPGAVVAKVAGILGVALILILAGWLAGRLWGTQDINAKASADSDARYRTLVESLTAEQRFPTDLATWGGHIACTRSGDYQTVTIYPGTLPVHDARLVDGKVLISIYRPLSKQ